MRKTNKISDTFEDYIKERGENRPIAEIPPQELNHMLASFWAERRKADALSLVDWPLVSIV